MFSKKDVFPIISVTFTLLTLSSCAGLGLGSDSDKEAIDDPIAAAAEAIRSPASLSPEERLFEESRISRARMTRDLVLGMNMNDVVSVWGEPRDVESAGDPSLGNQRWIYSEGLSHRGSLSASRVIYFEQGRVIGWEMMQPR